MALITGSGASETLLGTSGNDTIVSNGGVDTMTGYDGADVYQIYQVTPYTPVSGYHAIIDDQGTDGAVDMITGARGLYQSASFGYSNWASAERVGDDLVIELPGRPYRFRKPAIPTYTIEIKDHYAGNSVELLQIGTTTYNLATGGEGSVGADIIAGTIGQDVIRAYQGNDFITTHGGADRIWAGVGNDTVFSGDGNNFLKLGAGNDLATSGSGDDLVRGGSDNDTINAGDGRNSVFGGRGDDRLQTGSGDDLLKGGQGNDHLSAGDGNNTLYGGAGDDTLISGLGDDFLSGRKGGDIYEISSLGTGSDTILDDGDAAVSSIWAPINADQVKLTGFASMDQAVHSLSVTISGNDLILGYDNPVVAGAGQITVQNHFAGDRYAIEILDLDLGGYGQVFHFADVKGDQWKYSVHNGGDEGGNDIVFGTAGDDEIYSGFGYDIVLGGGGADVFTFEDEEANRGGLDLILDFDTANDVLDFSQIKTLTSAGVSITDSAYGNALISSIYGDIELAGITAAEIAVSDPMFLFA